MRIYQVGGAIRDALLGLPVHDRDWVVVGATPEQMLEQGFIPVGKDFPVFLHPHTHEEYALARTERKTAPGYHGFAFYTDATVTLEDDLARRDLTINAIAQDENGALIDPYHGQKDLQQKVLRHVTNAFAEDPVRILRVARFAARYADFCVAPETMVLMRQMVDAGEVDTLVAERVWQEISRGLLEEKPSRMLDVLRDCGALERILPEIALQFDTQVFVNSEVGRGNEQYNAGQHIQALLDLGVEQHNSLAVQFALLLDMPDHNDRESIQTRAQRGQQRAEQISARLRVPTDCSELAQLSAKEKQNVLACMTANAQEIYELFKRSDAFRQTQRFINLLKVAQTDALLRNGGASVKRIQMLENLLQQVLALDTKTITREAMAQGKKGKDVGLAIEQARLGFINANWP